MELTDRNLNASLRKYFGFDSFKGDQKEIIHSLLDGKDVFVLMPTGGGKSLCYQLPAIISEGTAIVVSPLIALMKNQVDFIRGLFEEEGIAHVLNSSLNKSETQRVLEDIRNGVTKLLFVAPESLAKRENLEFFKSVPISFYAIDEAHCISEWGHDFRPEYRNLRSMIDEIQDRPIIALTATATTKVQEDILRNLEIPNASVFKASFNRPNLFYEVRPKVEVDKQIIKFVKNHEGKSGIIYCLSRKKVEELSQLLQVNGLKAIPYHAGLDAKTRARHQDEFLMEEVDIVVATIAFGMGIDKPDVRFVIHYDFPKSLEGYYQETGRAGRDGGEGICLAFYDYKDIEKLEKFLSGKPVSEREVGMQLLNEMVAYAETSMSRRKFILHYFGEEFDEVNGEGADMDDNMRNPKTLIDVQDDLTQVLKIVNQTNGKLKLNDLVKLITGIESTAIQTYELQDSDFFGIAKEEKSSYWKSILRQAVVHNYLIKEVETYGNLKISDKGKDFLKQPHAFNIIEDHNYAELSHNDSQASNKTAVLDKELVNNLKDIRRKVAKKNGIPPFAVFHEGSLEDMAVQYPETIEDLSKVYGVGEGKAKKFGKDFINYISKYVKENDIVRQDDLVIRNLVNKSTNKVYIIQSIDRKMNLEDIASAKKITMADLLSEMESIVYQGTKLDISYYLDDVIDEETQEEFMDYLTEDADSDSMTELLEEFGDELDDDEIRLLRINFISKVAN